MRATQTFLFAVCLSFVLPSPASPAQETKLQEPNPRGREFLEFVRSQATSLRKGDQVPSTPAQWHEQRAQLREQLRAAWGGFPADPSPLEPQKLGELSRDGYRVERIIFQTLPGVWMTANAYVPSQEGKHPAVLCVHGHWRGAKQDPVVQSRCIGLVKHGFFVLVVDAFGAGERATGKALGEYHGEMTGATLFPIGLPLSGLQVYENQRAVDYLRSRPEVDGERIGITGASGGGNQSMYAGAWDERLRAVVPVCSVGTYESYLGAACCMCEVVPGAIRFTEEWGVLALAAPRGLMVINATRDAPQFSVEKARVSIEKTQAVFDLLESSKNLKHSIFEAPHDYNREMRETMYGWMKHQLAGSPFMPLPEPEIKTEEPEQLRCYPGDSRPDDFLTLPKFAAREGRRLLATREAPATPAEWQRFAHDLRQKLKDQVLGGDPPASELAPAWVEGNPANRAVSSKREFDFAPEPGLRLTVQQSGTDDLPIAMVLDLDGAEKAAASPLAVELKLRGWNVVTLDLRATGKLAYPHDNIMRAPDHNSAEWAMWIGRPLLGQWVVDVRRTLDALQVIRKAPVKVAVAGSGPAGLVAICAAALDERIEHVAAINMLHSYVTDVPYEGQRLGILVPGILRDIGDIPDLVSLVAPRSAVIAGGVTGAGKPLGADELPGAYQRASQAWGLSQAPEKLKLIPVADVAEIVKAWQ